EASITNPFERFFTLASGVDHIESRSLPGVSLVKIYFQPGTDADSDVSIIANLAMAQLRRLPQGTLPPVVLKFDASSLPVCLVTLKGQGLDETELHDLGQYNVRNQIANVPGASVPQPFGGKYRQIMVYVDPLKLQAHQLSPMDVVRQINESDLILPAGDVKIGPFDYNLYSNAQAPDADAITTMPLKTIGQSSVMVADVGTAVDAQAIQTNIVRVDGQPSVYLPILRQGGDTNTIAVVNGIRDALKQLVDVPKQLVTRVVFDQSVFVKTAIKNLITEGAIGLVLTGWMVLLFLGSMRATAAVFLSIPLSALAAFLAINAGGGTVNTMVLGGLALVFSRLIDNSVIVLENIFRHLEMGEAPEVAAEKGGNEVALAVLAATLATAIVFFPVVFLYGVSRFLFIALASSVVFALFASYMVAMTVVPLYCAKLMHKHEADEELEGDTTSVLGRIVRRFDRGFEKTLVSYDKSLAKTLLRPVAAVVGLAGVSLLCLSLYPLLGVSFFPRTDAGQFVINLKAPSGTRVELTEDYVKQVEQIIREVIPKNELQMIVSNIGITPDFSVIYTPNSAPHTAFVQASLREGHQVGSYEYMSRVREQIQKQLPQLTVYFQTGGLVDAVLNLGLPAPIDIQVSGSDMDAAHAVASRIASETKQLSGVSDVLIPQDVDYPEETVKTMADLRQIPLRGPKIQQPTSLDSVVTMSHISAPTEVDHYQLARVMDVYVAPKKEDLGTITSQIEEIIRKTPLPEGVRVKLGGSVQGMRASFRSFGIGLILSVVLVYLILVAQFASWTDPFIILLAVPPGLAGVLLFLLMTNTTLNVMSLMGLVMMVGIVVSNSILIVEFARHLHKEGKPVKEAVATASRQRLRPVLMTSLATLLGLIPLALGIEAGSEAYAPLARAIIGGLLVSVVVTVYLVPPAYLLVHHKEETAEVQA